MSPPKVEGVKLVGTSRNDEIQTPDNLYGWLDNRFAFNYDAFASHENAKCLTYSTIEGTFRKGRDTALGFDASWPVNVQIDALDGLRQTWSNRRVFCNPPYSRGLLSRCIDKMVEERNNAKIIVALVKVDTSTKWWRKLAAHSHIEYLPRVKFYIPGEETASAATFPSAVAILRPDIEKDSLG